MLATINFVESKFRRVSAPALRERWSYAVLPATFAAYGRGDIGNPRHTLRLPDTFTPTALRSGSAALLRVQPRAALMSTDPPLRPPDEQG